MFRAGKAFVADSPFIAPHKPTNHSIPAGLGDLYIRRSLLPHQCRVSRAVFSDDYDLTALSGPWSSGKTHALASILWAILCPRSRRHVPGSQSLLISASLSQAILGPFAVIREAIEASPDRGEFRVSQSSQQAKITHVKTGTSVKVWAVSGRRSMGLLRIELAAAELPASWPEAQGELMYKVLTGALLKPGGVRRLCIAGTLAPARAGHWWRELVGQGTSKKERTYVELLQGDAGTWDDTKAIRRVNPLLWKTAKGRTGLLAERDAGHGDTTKKADFMRYRLNVPAADEQSVLLTVPQWERVKARIPPNQGRGGRLSGSIAGQVNRGRRSLRSGPNL